MADTYSLADLMRDYTGRSEFDRSPLLSLYMQFIRHQQTAGQPHGIREFGNVDLLNRPVVRNADGSVSTVRSMGVNIDGQEALLPTVADDGRYMSPDEAIQQYRTTGRHMGIFDSPFDATSFARWFSQGQPRRLGAP